MFLFYAFWCIVFVLWVISAFEYLFFLFTILYDLGLGLHAVRDDKVFEIEEVVYICLFSVE